MKNSSADQADHLLRKKQGASHCFSVLVLRVTALLMLTISTHVSVAIAKGLPHITATPNVAPTLSSIESSTLAYAEDQAATTITSLLVVGDVDNANLASATVKITTNYLSSQDVLQFTDAFGITGSFNSTNGTLTLAGVASLADYQNALRSVTYQNTNTGAPSTLSRVITFTVNDGLVNSSAVVRTVSVSASNDTPVLASIEGTDLAFTEGQAATSITAAILVTDPDLGNLTGATIKITSNHLNSEDVISFTNASGITGSWDGTTGTLTLSGSATVANYQTALRNVKYRNSNNNAPSNLTRTISFTVTDGFVNSNTVTRSVTVAPVNDAPNAAADFFSTSSNTVLNANFRSNDTDAENNTITVNTTPVTAPAHGTVVINASGAFVYTPDGVFSGVETFMYEICDNGNDNGVPAPKCSQGTVTLNINPVNTKFNIVGNSAIQLTEQCFVLTQDMGNQQGAVWSRTPVDLRFSFELNFEAMFSDTSVVKDNGADGIMFALQRDVTPPPLNAAGSPIDARGSVGEYLGIGGVSPSIGIEIDTYQNGGEPAEDHIAISRDGSVYNIISPAVPAKVDGSNSPLNIEDGVSHTIKIAWDKPTNTLSVYFDGVLRTTYTGDIITNIFGGNPTDVYWGFSASTGGSTNLQGVCSIAMDPINLAPQAVNDLISVNEDNVLNASMIGNDSDPEGGTLKVTAETKATTHGTVTINAAGTYAYTPAANYSGSDSFTYSVCDDYSTPGCSSATVNITVVQMNDDDPISVADNYSVSEDATLSVTAPGVLSNDTEPDGQAMTAILNTSATHGTLALNADGSFIYTPFTNYNGVDQFTYHADDGVSSAATVTVSLVVNSVNDAPVAVNDIALSDEDTDVAIAVVNNDTDVDNALDVATVSVVSGPAHGSAFVSVATGVITYSPAQDYSGPDSFTYAVKDVSGSTSNTATVSITISPINDAPAAIDNNVSVNEDSFIDIDVVANDVDIDNQINVTTVSLVNNTSHGVLSLNGATGIVSYTPDENYFGSDFFTYRVNDVSGAQSNLATVNITVVSVNDAPKGNLDLVTTNQEPIAIDILANDVDNDNAIDATSVSIAFQPNNGSITVAPNGIVTYVPNADYIGGDSFSYTVKDVDGASTDITVVFITVNPSNLPPVAVDDGPIQFISQQPVTFDVLENDSDPDNDVLTISATSVPSVGAVTIEDNKIVYHPSEMNTTMVITFNYEIQDDDGESASAAVTLEYEPFAVSEGFSPNGDNNNDYWYIRSIEHFPGNTVKVFDRWGLMVYHSRGYDNGSVRWDGRSNTGTQSGKMVDQGTYYYTLELGDRTKTISGYVVIVR